MLSIFVVMIRSSFTGRFRKNNQLAGALEQGELVAVEEAEVTEFEVGDDEEGHERQGHEGGGEGAAEAFGEVVDGGVGCGDGVAVVHAHEAGDGEGQNEFGACHGDGMARRGDAGGGGWVGR
jgi:hypothetical protein